MLRAIVHGTCMCIRSTGPERIAEVEPARAFQGHPGVAYHSQKRSNAKLRMWWG